MTELTQVRLHPEGVWAISPREGVMTDSNVLEIMEALRELGVRGIVLRAPVRVAPLTYGGLIEAARKVVDVPGGHDFRSELNDAVMELSDVLDELDVGS